MYRYSGGYTIIETMIFLAVSGALFVSAVTLISGRQGRTQFQQSMQDTDAKVQQYINEVNATYFPASDKYYCSSSKTDGKVYPTLTALSVSAPKNESGSNEECIFLGKALQFFHDPNPNNDDYLYVYNVIARRYAVVPVYEKTTDPSDISRAPGWVYRQEPVPDLSKARPITYLNDDKGLEEKFTIPWGAKILSAKGTINGVDSQSAMAGFYSSLGQSDPSGVNSSNSAKNVASYLFPPDVSISTDPTTSATQIINCIKLTACGSLNIDADPPVLPDNLIDWRICFESSTSPQTALLTVNTSDAGIKTKIEFKDCT